MLTTSDADGECLNAIRMANKELKKFNLNWEQVFLNRAKEPEPQKQEEPEDRFGQSRRSLHRGFIRTQSGNYFHAAKKTTVFNRFGRWHIVINGTFLQGEFGNPDDAIDYLVDNHFS